MGRTGLWLGVLGASVIAVVGFDMYAFNQVQANPLPVSTPTAPKVSVQSVEKKPATHVEKQYTLAITPSPDQDWTILSADPTSPDKMDVPYVNNAGQTIVARVPKNRLQFQATGASNGSVVFKDNSVIIYLPLSYFK